jgi:hypothetical protein
MVLNNKVSISIMFCVMFRGFLSFDILAISKNMFFISFYHVFYMFLSYFLQVSFLALYNKVL